MQREHSGASQPTSPTYVDSCSTSAAVGVSLLPLRAPPTPLHNNIDPHFNVQSSHEAGFAITIGRARLCAPSRPCRCSRSRSRTMLLVGTRTPRQILQSKPSPHRNSRLRARNMVVATPASTRGQRERQTKVSRGSLAQVSLETAQRLSEEPPSGKPWTSRKL